MMKRHILPLICLGATVALAGSCHSGSGGSGSSDSANSPVTKLTNQIETLHEQAMNKVAPLRSLEDSLRTQISRLAAKGDTTQGDTARLSALASRLNTCDTTMFGWMGRYDMQLEGKSDAEKAAYLSGQVRELSGIDDSIDSAMAAARGALQSAAAGR